MTLFLLFLPLLFLFLRSFYGLIELFMPFILLFLLFFLVFYSDQFLASFTLVIVSGFLGLAVFTSTVNQNFVLLPVFSGLFAAPAIARGLSGEFNIPDQESARFKVDQFEAGFLGSLAGFMAGVLPGMGAATSTAFFTPLMESEKDFLASMGAVNTSDAIMSLTALLILGKARSGTAVALSQVASLDNLSYVFALGISLFSVALASATAYRVSPKIFRFASVLSLKTVFLAVALLILAITIIFTGYTGILILLTSSSVGYAAALKDLRRCCMAVLIFPAFSFYATGLFL